MTRSADDDRPLATDDQSEAGQNLWDEVRIQPIKLALPSAIVGYTLRAYRPASELAAPAVDETESSAEPVDADQEEEVELEVAESATTDPDGAAAEEEPELTETAEQTEEVPVFLSHRGRLLLFSSPESLVAFVHSDAPHDLIQLDTWQTFQQQVQPSDIVPTDEDTYELDLVVENLRGGHDAWDTSLLVAAGEIARDLGWALRLEPVITALSPESPLDDLDEALRAATEGGFKGMRGRRRLRRIGAQQASLGWRTIIGKISGAVDWRD